MVNINLYKEEERLGENKISGSNFWRSGTFFSIIIFILVSSIYAGQVFYKKKLVKDESAITQEIAQKRNSIGNATLAGIKDFDIRSGEVNSNLGQRVYPNDILSYVEKSMLKNVYIESYSYDDLTKKITIVSVADNFSTIASQLLNFKKCGKFSDVNISSTNRNEKGGINFTVTMKLSDYSNPEDNL